MIKFITDIDNYESHFVEFVDNLIKFLYTDIYKNNTDHVMIDVGANIGTITEIMLTHINKTSGLVIAIDAHPKWLDQFIYAQHKLVKIYNIGCYSEKRIKKFIAHTTMTGIGFIGMPPDPTIVDLTDLHINNIECDTLDNIIKLPDNKKIALIKIDAESADFEIILGSSDIIKKYRPFIIFEFSGQCIERIHAHTRIDFFEFFNQNQYSVYSVGLGRSTEYIADHWDERVPEFKDILAVPNEYKRFVNKEEINE